MLTYDYLLESWLISHSDRNYQLMPGVDKVSGQTHHPLMSEGFEGEPEYSVIDPTNTVISLTFKDLYKYGYILK